MTLLTNKEVRTVTVTYADGETETFDPIVGYHRAKQGYDRGLPNPGPAKIEHEIRWAVLAPPPPDPE